LQPAAAFPSVPAAPPPAASSSGGWFSLKPYAVYFDVDTADVLHRMRLACVPFGSSFMTTVKDKPDLCVTSLPFCVRQGSRRACAR
jgi:hypothetical protein